LEDGDYDLGHGVLAERKTDKDFLANFEERLPQQILRLSEACPWPVVLIEGDIFGPTTKGSVPHDGRMAFLWWAYFEKGVWLAQTKTAQQTAKWLVRIATQLANGAKPPALHQGKTAAGRAHQLTLLQAVKGIGPAGAVKLLDRFGSARAVLGASELALAAVIGPAAAKRVCAILDEPVGPDVKHEAFE
jgi:ERCC4-type nuclease